jgi:hypothetical protein
LHRMRRPIRRSGWSRPDLPRGWRLAGLGTAPAPATAARWRGARRARALIARRCATGRTGRAGGGAGGRAR